METRLKREANRLGFVLVGIAPALVSDGFDRLGQWLKRGYAGEMSYLHRHHLARQHPASILPEVRSVVMVAMAYGRKPTGNLLPNHGRVARYAWGVDYHDAIRNRLKRLLDWVQREKPGSRGRAVVDTAPLLERDFARRAGLGWIGKNTMLIHRQHGSFTLLGGLLLDIDLTPDTPHWKFHCGTCTACLDACPTQALVEPGWLDARKCISYLTIELRSSVPSSLAPGIGEWVFGCDVCQEVCPWNRKSPPATVEGFGDRQDLEQLDLLVILKMTEESFRTRFKGTALMRSGRGGLLRNAALVLGCQGDGKALPVLEEATKDEDPLVSEAAQWALAKIKDRMKET